MTALSNHLSTARTSAFIWETICPELFTSLFNWFRNKDEKRRTGIWENFCKKCPLSDHWISRLSREINLCLCPLNFQSKTSCTGLTVGKCYMQIEGFSPISLINVVWTLVNHLIIYWGQNIYREAPAHSKLGFAECWYPGECTLRSVLCWLTTSYGLYSRH